MKTQKFNLSLNKTSITELSNQELSIVKGGGDSIDLLTVIIRNWTRPIL